MGTEDGLGFRARRTLSSGMLNLWHSASGAWYVASCCSEDQVSSLEPVSGKLTSQCMAAGAARGSQGSRVPDAPCDGRWTAGLCCASRCGSGGVASGRRFSVRRQTTGLRRQASDGGPAGCGGVAGTEGKAVAPMGVSAGCGRGDECSASAAAGSQPAASSTTAVDQRHQAAKVSDLRPGIGQGLEARKEKGFRELRGVREWKGEREKNGE